MHSNLGGGSGVNRQTCRSNAVRAGFGNSGQGGTVGEVVHVADGEDDAAAAVDDNTANLVGIISFCKGKGYGNAVAYLYRYRVIATVDNGGGTHLDACLHHIDGVAVPAVAVTVLCIDDNIARTVLAVGAGANLNVGAGVAGIAQGAQTQRVDSVGGKVGDGVWVGADINQAVADGEEPFGLLIAGSPADGNLGGSNCVDRQVSGLRASRWGCNIDAGNHR